MDSSTTDNKTIGKVKWFSEAKGYGFITDQQNTDYFFGVSSIIGSNLPTKGTTVSFQPMDGTKGKKATQVMLEEEPKSSYSTTVECTHCKKHMVPRIVYNRGTPDYSICPFCGVKYKQLSDGKWPIILAVVIGVVIFLFAI